MTNGWDYKTIGEICDLNTGGTPSRSKPEYFGGEIRWLVSGDIHNKEIFDCEGRITPEGVENSNARILPIDSVMIALNGQGKTRGTVALLRTEATCNQSLVSIAPKNKERLLPEYLFHNLNGRYDEIRKMTGDDGNDRRGLNMPIIRSIKIPVPPIEEQKRIVAILDEAFACIEKAKANTKNNIQNARELFDSYLNNIFSNPGPDWEKDTLGNIATFRNGINFTKSSRGETMRIVGVRDFQKSFWAPMDSLETITADGKVPESDLLKENDLLFVRSNGNKELIGRSLLVGPVSGKVTHSGFTIRARINGSGVVPHYVCRYVKSDLVRQRMIEGGTGTNIKSLNQTMLSDITIPLPSVSEQHEIVAKLDGMDGLGKRLNSICRTKIIELDELKKSLLQKAFSGEIR